MTCAEPGRRWPPGDRRAISARSAPDPTPPSGLTFHHPDGQPLGVRQYTANANHDLGITAVRGVIDGGGNQASGNGNPAQCTNIACR
jgi:hypothetical protein